MTETMSLRAAAERAFAAASERGRQETENRTFREMADGQSKASERFNGMFPDWATVVEVGVPVIGTGGAYGGRTVTTPLTVGDVHFEAEWEVGRGYGAVLSVVKQCGQCAALDRVVLQDWKGEKALESLGAALAEKVHSKGCPSQQQAVYRIKSPEEELLDALRHFVDSRAPDGP